MREPRQDMPEPMSEEDHRSWRGLAARGAVAAARGAARLVPGALRRRLEDRLYAAVGHATRVTNDGYPQPAELIPPAGKAKPRP